MTKRRLILVTLVAVIAGFIASSASTHATGTFYPLRWQRDLSQTWHMTASFPGGTYRDRIRSGVAQWNNRNQPLTFTQGSQVSDFSPFDCRRPTERTASTGEPLEAEHSARL
jgi:hypothetical protein